MSSLSKAEYDKEYRIKNRDRIIKREKQYYYANIDATRERRRQYQKMYRLTHQDKIIQYRLQNKEKMRQWYQKNKERIKLTRKKWNHQTEHIKRNNLKKQIFEKFNNKCVRCGFSDIRALQIDHINGGGQRDREFFNGNMILFYKHVLENLKDFQVLCANCNWIKRIENNESRGRACKNLREGLRKDG